MTDVHELRDHLRRHLHWGPVRDEDKIRFLALALCGEVGEFANLIKKDWRGDQGDRFQKLVDELADVANYTFIIAEALGVDLMEAMLKKLIEVEKRPEFRIAIEQKGFA